MNDQEIVRLYFDRNQQAISETGRKYGSYCYTIAWNILYNREDSEACVNDTYMDTWNAIPPAIPKVLRHFLSGIVRRTAGNDSKKKNGKGKAHSRKTRQE